MQFQDLEFRPLPKRFKHDRIYILCVLKVPENQQDKIPRSQLQKCHGSFLLGFNIMPSVGSVYPYQGQLWELVKPPLQFPHRFNSQQEKYAPIAVFKWVGGWESLSDVVENYLD